MKNARFWTYAVIMFLFGWLGVHRFMSGKTKLGIVYLLTYGLFGFGTLHDLFQLAQGKFKDKDGDPVATPPAFQAQPLWGGFALCSPVIVAIIIFFIAIANADPVAATQSPNQLASPAVATPGTAWTAHTTSAQPTPESTVETSKNP